MARISLFISPTSSFGPSAFPNLPSNRTKRLASMREPAGSGQPEGGREDTDRECPGGPRGACG